MTSTKLYTAIYVVLFVLATGQVLIEQFEGFTYWTAFAIIMIVSTVKAVVVAGYYQHLRSEPRAVTYVVLGGLTAALALTVAASYSIL
ncbi:cytochrome C oxidase subunit IV family protein [Halorarum salinum]|uniref:Cytochrome C oxidase subunit IV family protein n=1 Tax=Halorarum salinum TaxID=2743089 RepID=A0A7D5L9L7_9EURY|nr:cytochrome C oxidase subunit IV family protein [Halobaculum salinum]QLG60949.1 cytochrome C oxidase subunit IV family protein [Halobaculum salinum]